MTEQMPSVGRIMHFVEQVDGKHVCRAALITATGTWGPLSIDVVSLAVFHPTGLTFEAAVVHDEQQQTGTCHWPERV